MAREGAGFFFADRRISLADPDGEDAWRKEKLSQAGPEILMLASSLA
jgi:hypothetical protein